MEKDQSRCEINGISKEDYVCYRTELIRSFRVVIGCNLISTENRSSKRTLVILKNSIYNSETLQ